MWFEGPSLSYLLLPVTFSYLMSLNEAGSSHLWKHYSQWVSILEPLPQFSLPPHAQFLWRFHWSIISGLRTSQLKYLLPRHDSIKWKKNLGGIQSPAPWENAPCLLMFPSFGASPPFYILCLPRHSTHLGASSLWCLFWHFLELPAESPSVGYRH